MYPRPNLLNADSTDLRKDIPRHREKLTLITFSPNSLSIPADISVTGESIFLPKHQVLGLSFPPPNVNILKSEHFLSVTNL